MKYTPAIINTLAIKAMDQEKNGDSTPVCPGMTNMEIVTLNEGISGSCFELDQPLQIIRTESKIEVMNNGNLLFDITTKIKENERTTNLTDPSASQK